MTDRLTKWFKHNLDNLVSVQNTTISQTSLVANLWSGVRVRVYLIDQPLKTRVIKKALQDATNIGVGSMFIVSSTLVPDEGEQTVPEEWLQAIHAITGEQLYTYRIDRGHIRLNQVHFEPLSGLGKWEIQHGKAFIPNRLRFYTLSVKPRYIRGTWLVSDFDSPAFWKENDYRRHRERKRQQRRRSTGNTRWQDWSTFRTWSNNQQGSGAGNGNVPGASPLKSFLDECYMQLGITSDAGQTEVKAAYRKLVREVHPDVSELPKDEAEVRFRVINEAYQYIKSANNW